MVNMRFMFMFSQKKSTQMRLVQNNLTFDANAKLLKFAGKVKTASSKCRVDMITW